jgi:hypothetical protein
MPPGAPPTRGESGDKASPWYRRYPGTYPAPANSSLTLLGAGDGAGGTAAVAGLGSTGAGDGADGMTAGAGLGSATAAGSPIPAGAPGDATGAGPGSADTAASAVGPASGRASNFRIRSAQITPRPGEVGKSLLPSYGPGYHRFLGCVPYDLSESRPTSRAAGKERREPDRNVPMYLRTGSAGPTPPAARIVGRRLFEPTGHVGQSRFLWPDFPPAGV